MPNNTPFWDLIALKLIVFLPKIAVAIIGAVFGLMLSGDIGKDGKIKVSMPVMIKFVIAVTISLVGGIRYVSNRYCLPVDCAHAGQITVGDNQRNQRRSVCSLWQITISIKPSPLIGAFFWS